MISYISGVVEEIEKDKVVVDNNGIGYGIFASQSTLEPVSYTHLDVYKRQVMGISFLSLSETPGLGMKAKDDDFMSQFSNKKVDFFKYTKSEAKADNEINAISSATITSNAVTHGVNGAIYCVDFITGGGK